MQDRYVLWAMAQYSDEIKYAARSLFLRKHKIAEIHKELKVPVRTLYYWCDTEGWKDLLRHESAQEALTRRLVLLSAKEEKSQTDLAEYEILIRGLDRLQKIEERSWPQSDDADHESKRPQGGKRGKKSKGKKRKNDVSHLTEKDFADKLHKHYFAYQHELRESKKFEDRFILKSRQIGATWYFAQEAFEDACLTGDNQIFLSATRAQADVFRAYIISIADEKFGIELKGKDKIELHTAKGKATLYFLSNNSSSAQSYHGHVYIDECFWINKFSKLYEVATGMAAHAKWRTTLFSTPSIVTHEAYPLWTGDEYNKRFKRKRVDFPSFEAMQKGVLCQDGFWRKIITLDDAERGGCDLFNVERLKLKYSPAVFKNLFGCQFIDGSQGVFRLSELERCAADNREWKDFKKNADRPFGNKPVWGGYDPSRTRDDASFVIVAPPLREGDKFRVLERHTWVGQSLRWQAERIKELTQKYNFDYIGVDTTGPGLGVFEMIQQFYANVVAIHYGLATKTALVLKAQDVITHGRIEWDARENDIAPAFLTIKQITTPNGGVSYAANRTNATGHADVAFAIMHALYNEPLADLPGGGCDFGMSD